MEIIKIIEIACIGFLFVESEPMILLKRFGGFKEEEYHNHSRIKQFFHRLLYCCLCSSFWLGLAITHSLYEAALVSVLSELICKILKRL